MKKYHRNRKQKIAARILLAVKSKKVGKRQKYRMYITEE